MTIEPPPGREADDERPPPGEFEREFGEPLRRVLDLATWSPGSDLVALYDKSLVALMQASGIDVTDQDAISGFIGGFNELPELERKRLLPLPGEEAAPLNFPPARLASQAELLAAADAAPAVERLRRFTSWVGQGRKLTQKGRLTLADAKALVELLGTADQVDPVIGDEVFRTRSSAELPEVAVTFAWARAACLVRVVHGRVVPVKRSQPLLDRTLDLWGRALDGLRQLGPDIVDDTCSGRSSPTTSTR
jgi:hypothetical protein